MAVALNIANASAAGTTAGAPTPMSVGAPAVQPGGPQPPLNPNALAQKFAASPPKGSKFRPPVAPHAGVQSVGTHPAASPLKRQNPTHPFGK